MHYLSRYGPDAFTPLPLPLPLSRANPTALHTSQPQLSSQTSTIREFYSSSMFQTKPILPRTKPTTTTTSHHKLSSSCHIPPAKPQPQPSRSMKGKLVDMILDMIKDTKKEIQKAADGKRETSGRKFIQKGKEKGKSGRFETVEALFKEKSVDVIPIVLKKRPDIEGKAHCGGFRTPRIRLKSSLACYDKAKTEGREDKSWREGIWGREETQNGDDGKNREKRERRRNELIGRRQDARAPQFKNEELTPW